MDRYRQRHDQGFTLVELLVVVVILGVLAAIAIPATAAQRTKAIKAALKGDLHAAVTAEMAYATEVGSYTTDVTQLLSQGYKATPQVTLHVKVLGPTFVACTSHPGTSGWLVYDGVTGQMDMADDDCA